FSARVVALNRSASVPSNRGPNGKRLTALIGSPEGSSKSQCSERRNPPVMPGPLRPPAFALLLAPILAFAGCSASNDRPKTTSSTSTTGGAGGGALDDGSASDALPEGGHGGIMVGPRPDSDQEECVDRGRRPITKIDLLFMIDNSSS